jgi:hypothetical protein
MCFLDFWDSPKLHHTKACTNGLDGCELMRLTILPSWKILFDVRQDHQKLKGEYLPYSTWDKILKVGDYGAGFIEFYMHKIAWRSPLKFSWLGKVQEKA